MSRKLGAVSDNSRRLRKYGGGGWQLGDSCGKHGAIVRAEVTAQMTTTWIPFPTFELEVFEIPKSFTPRMLSVPQPRPCDSSVAASSLDIKSHQVTGQRYLVALPFVARRNVVLILHNVFEFPQLYHTSTSGPIICLSDIVSDSS
ncbi:hypothetical protein SAY87_006086 [Trapa incisa]|uniref:Uncharacterized protein n=1 Tax=Trapa incisa TaxID=236973 RepID=A0AAN7Q876_9MYRT|nr:hypothetical protein SAY87_006086 [Trapa incisa]